MALQTLPSDTIAKISSYLPRADRTSLALSCSALSRQLHKTNRSLWFDVYHSRFAHRCTNPPPSVKQSNWHASVQLSDIVDDYYCHKTVPFVNLNLPDDTIRDSKSTLLPLTAVHNKMLYIASGGTFSAFRRVRNSWQLNARFKLDTITSLATSPTGQVALGYSSRSVLIYDPSSRTFGRHMRGHKAPVTSLAFVKDILASGSPDKTIRLRDTNSRRSLAVLRGHDAPVRWLADAGNSRLLSHGGADGRVKLWDVSRAVCVSTGRPGGAVEHAVVGESVVYVAAGRCVHVLDARMPLCSTAAVLSLPSGRAWSEAGGIGAMALSANGRLAAGVGGAGVAVWDPHGRWEARGLGWPMRWYGDAGRRIRAVMLTSSCVVAGGGARELYTFSVNGVYEGMVFADDGVVRAGVSSIVEADNGFVVGMSDGRVDYADVECAEADWEVAERVANDENGTGRRGFWTDDGGAESSSSLFRRTRPRLQAGGRGRSGRSSRQTSFR